MSADQPHWHRRMLLPSMAFLVLLPGDSIQARDEDVEAQAPEKVVVRGVVTYDGPLPEPVQVFEAATVRPLVEVDPQSKGLKEAVVWLEGVPEFETETDLPGDESQDQQEPAVMDQENYFFLPHVLAVQAGQEVEFLNSDLANHGISASSLEPRNQFNVITPLGGIYKHTFRASRHPVAIGCPIHGSMAAWIYVLDHSDHAVTDPQGRFRLPPVPPGRYTLQIRHPSGGMRLEQEIEVRSGESEELRIKFQGDEGEVRPRLRSLALMI